MGKLPILKTNGDTGGLPRLLSRAARIIYPMKTTHPKPPAVRRRPFLRWCFAFCILHSAFCLAPQAATTINAVNRFAYGANLGWMDWRGDGANGAVIGAFVCSGNIYAANVGWIALGDGTPANGVRYANNAGADSGVNHDGAGNLSRLAWSANLGWINFGWAAPADANRPRFDLLSGEFAGLAWSSNAGWINLATGLLKTDSMCVPDSDADGISDKNETGNDGRYNPGEDSNPLVQDTDGDGLKDGLEDTNKNGNQDANESNPIDRCSPTATTSFCDFDTDGIINAFDLDDDNDGVADLMDLKDFDPASDSDNDGIADGIETGNDGIYHAGTDSNPLNPCDPTPSPGGGCVPKDLDNDGFFENYPVTHSLFDQNDANPCIPNSTAQVCPCHDYDGDGKITICTNPLTAAKKSRSISLWLWPMYAAQGAVCGPCQN